MGWDGMEITEEMFLLFQKNGYDGKSVERSRKLFRMKIAHLKITVLFVDGGYCTVGHCLRCKMCIGMHYCTPLPIDNSHFTFQLIDFS